MVEKQTSFIVWQFYLDRGGKYTNNQLTIYFSQQETIYKFTLPYVHKFNGISELFNQTLQNMAKPWLIGLNKRFWVEVYAAVVYNKNHLPHSSEQDMILFEVFHHMKPSISHLQLFGTKCFIHIFKERILPESKLMLWVEEGIFLRYGNTPYIYKVYILARNHTFIVFTYNVKFESIIADSRLGVEITTADVTLLDVNSISSITITLILLIRPIIVTAPKHMTTTITITIADRAGTGHKVTWRQLSVIQIQLSVRRNTVIGQTNTVLRHTTSGYKDYVIGRLYYKGITMGHDACLWIFYINLSYLPSMYSLLSLSR